MILQHNLKPFLLLAYINPKKIDLQCDLTKCSFKKVYCRKNEKDFGKKKPEREHKNKKKIKRRNSSYFMELYCWFSCM